MHGAGEAKDALKLFLGKVPTDELAKRSVLVFANKAELPNAMSAHEVADKMGLNELLEGHEWSIQASCAYSGHGLYEGIDWLVKSVTGNTDADFQQIQELKEDLERVQATYADLRHIKLGEAF